jgi:hypothetical protein
MGSAKNAIALGNNKWTNVPMMNTVLHPATGKEIQYKDIMKHPALVHSTKQRSTMNLAASIKESETSKVKTHASFLS